MFYYSNYFRLARLFENRKMYKMYRRTYFVSAWISNNDDIINAKSETFKQFTTYDALFIGVADFTKIKGNVNAKCCCEVCTRNECLFYSRSAEELRVQFISRFYTNERINSKFIYTSRKYTRNSFPQKQLRRGEGTRLLFQWNKVDCNFP